MFIYTVIWLIKYYPERVKYFSDSSEYSIAMGIGLFMFVLINILWSSAITMIISTDPFFEIILIATSVVLFSDLYILHEDLRRCKFNLRNFKPTNITIVCGVEKPTHEPVI